MHELSIVRSLLELIRRYTPPDARVRCVSVRFGPLHAIEPPAMELAWQAATQGTDLHNAELDLQLLPWRLSCPVCQRQWDSDDPFDRCTCGWELCQPKGSDEMTLLSLEIEEPDPIEEHHHASAHC